MSDTLPWDEKPALEPVRAGELVVTALDALLSAAALHMGKLMPDGRGLAEPDPMEAWIALLGASALYAQLQPLFDEEATAVYRQELVTLLEQFGTEHAGLAVPTPGADLAAMQLATQAAWEVLAPSERELPPEPKAPAASPASSKRSSGLLASLQGTGKLPSTRELT